MMVAATLTLTNCNKVSSIEEPAAKLFTIRANTGADSKTTNDGMHTLWAENDEVSLLYAPAGTDVTSEFTNVQMTIASGAGTSSAEFTGKATLSGSNDFYAIYPYSDKHKIPGQRNSGYIYVGNKNGVTQNGYDSMAHLSGSNCPMYGVALDNDDETIPEFSMKQLASVMELNIKNESGSEIVITKVEVEASEDIVGSYYIDIASATPVYTASGANYVSKVGIVNVTADADVANGSTVKVYLPIKPYTQAQGTPLKVTLTANVSGSAQTATVNVTASADAAKRTFHAGKIKRVPVSVSSFEAVTPSGTTLADLVAVAGTLASNTTSSDTYTVDEVRVLAKNGSNVVIEDDTDIMVYYGSNSVAAGDIASVTGKVKNQYCTPEIVNGKIAKSGTFTPDYSHPATFNATSFKETYDANQIVDITLVTFTGELDAEGKYVAIDGTSLKSAVYGIDATLKGKRVVVVGYPIGVGSAPNGNPINFVPVSVEEEGGVTPPPATGSQISDLISVAASLAKSATSTESYTVENAKVMAINGKNAVVQDATGIILYYGTLTDITVGDVVTMTGKVQNYYYTPEVTSGSLTKTGTFTPDYSGASTSFSSDIFKATYAANQQLAITLATVTGQFSADGKTLTVDGQTVEYAPYGTTAYANKTAEVTGYAIGVSSPDSGEKINFIPVLVNEVASPQVVVSPSNLSWSATDTSTKTVTVVCGNDWTVTGAPSWLTVTKVDATSFTVTPTANTGASRNATLTVTNSANSSYTATVSVSQGSALDKTYLWTTAAGQVTAAAGSVTVSNVKWDFSAATYIGFESANSARGLQIGSSNKPQTSEWTLSTDQISGTIKSVKVNACTGGSATLSISVGGVSYLSATSLTSTTTAYTGTGSSSGTIVITMQAGTKAMYIKSIEIVYN